LMILLGLFSTLGILKLILENSDLGAKEKLPGERTMTEEGANDLPASTLKVVSFRIIQLTS